MQADFGKQSAGETTPEGFLENIKAQLKIGLEDFASAVTRLTQASVEVNKVFTQGRQRIVELNQSVADAVPNVMRLGGEIGDVTKAISEVASASRRNVVASTEEVTKLYAAQKVLGEGASELTNSFLDVGMAVKDIGKSLEGSIQYVQSIGGNASEVVKTMRANMEQLNRYQFDGGVQGLTKMAAQASMLRFDMNQTFQLAEKVLSPENAIEVASAFQRLGVAAGNLTDPFALMNQSINDPSGIQDSLANVTKQFSYFDEKTKTFKINPQGVLTLKEMADQTGMSASELRKMSVAAADLDRRLSAVSSAGISIASEEDKQYLANIARMTEQGTYEVKIKDEKSGEYITKDLTRVTQDEFNKLIKEQKEGPKTLEEIARSQMSTTETIEADVSAIRSKLVGGVASVGAIGRGAEGFREFFQTLGGELSQVGETKDVREQVGKLIGGLESMGQDLFDPKKNKMEVFQQYLSSFGSGLESVKDRLTTAFTTALKKAEGKLEKGGTVERAGASMIGKITGTKKTTTEAAAQQAISNEKAAAAAKAVKETNLPYGAQTSTKVDMGGKITIDINITGNQTLTNEQRQELMKVLSEKFNSIDFQNYVINIQSAGKSNQSKGSGTPVFGGK